MSNSGYWYLGSPYSKYRFGMGAAFEAVCRNAALLIRAGVPVFSPIAHSHPIAELGDIDPTDHSVWLPADEPIMTRARGIIVLELEGWRDSFGLGCEIGYFMNHGLPIFHMTPGLVPADLIRAAA